MVNTAQAEKNIGEAGSGVEMANNEVSIGRNKRWIRRYLYDLTGYSS